MKRLHLAEDLALPLEAITQTFGVLAMRGAGKSNLAAAMAEEMFAAGLRCQRCDSPDITARVPTEEFKRAEWEDCKCYACGDVHEKETPIGERVIRASMFCEFCGWKWVTRWIPPLQAGNLLEAEAARLKEEAEAGR